jgi:hypothetical protein
MTYILTNEEKAGIVEQHIKNLEYSKYNLEVSLIEETVSPSSTAVVNSLQDQLLSIQLKIDALKQELSQLS